MLYSDNIKIYSRFFPRVNTNKLTFETYVFSLFVISQDRISVALEDIEEIMTQFRKDRKLQKLPYNEEQIHKIDK